MPQVLSREAPPISFKDTSAIFKALADPTRLKMLDYLSQQTDDACCSVEEAVCACDFETITGLSQPTVSHHMKLLIAAQLVKATKHGKWMFYQINPEGFAHAQKALATLGG